MKRKKLSDTATRPLAIFVAVLMLAGSISASEWKETVLHAFRGTSDGLAPYGRVIADAAGNLYGTTAFGGTSGAGIVFELANPGAPAGWTENILYTFTGGSDGSQPWAGLIFDAAGNLYGTTYLGGTANAGAVYELTPGQGGAWTETVLYSFAGGADGLGPQGDLNFDLAGNLYGTTTKGGSPGKGIVFELTPPAQQGGAWTETVLHRFLPQEGSSPRAAVIFGKSGALYGTLANNGAHRAGAVFRLLPPTTKGGAWTERTIYQFTGGADGYGPLCRLVLFKGSLYGTTVGGGASNNGVIFQLAPPAIHHFVWTETVLRSFTCGNDACWGWAGLTMGKANVFYGATQHGGPLDGGAVFQLKLENGIWTERTLYSFKSDENSFSAAEVLLGEGGTLYGTTVGYAGNAGMVFELVP
jgi:uncharacterized repeat protein (TIGR03803 family)